MYFYYLGAQAALHSRNLDHLNDYLLRMDRNSFEYYFFSAVQALRNGQVYYHFYFAMRLIVGKRNY
jgi:hypothetical protein